MKRTIFYNITIVLIAIAVTSCAAFRANDDDEAASESTTVEFKGDPAKKKSIFVFMDGTANDTKSATNVSRLFRLIQGLEHKQVAAKYLRGVGTTKNSELSSSQTLGRALGQGMESRIKVGYDFLAKNYAPGDDIYIFGFSRGAHEARSLAGFVSYVGIPITTETSARFGTKEWNKILEITKGKSDVDYDSYWNSWAPNKMPPLAGEAGKELGVEFQPVQITLLGVWDTVPGSSFKEFGICKELPDGKDGDRYKSDSYPSIRSFAHAVAIDEKRDKFKPLLLCPAKYPLDDNLKPSLIEKWFPGAHADVGGGYSDGDNALPNISLNWMVAILGKTYDVPTDLNKFPENVNGLAHWSVGDMSPILGMRCEDRPTPSSDATHESARLRTGQPPICVKGKVKNYPYPIRCADEKKLLDAPDGLPCRSE